MTNSAAPRNNPAVLRADLNRARRLQAIRELEKLLRLAIDPGFTGTVAVKLSAKRGSLGQVRVAMTRFPEE